MQLCLVMHNLKHIFFRYIIATHQFWIKNNTWSSNSHELWSKGRWTREFWQFVHYEHYRNTSRSKSSYNRIDESSSTFCWSVRCGVQCSAFGYCIAYASKSFNWQRAFDIPVAQTDSSQPSHWMIPLQIRILGAISTDYTRIHCASGRLDKNTGTLGDRVWLVTKCERYNYNKYE